MGSFFVYQHYSVTTILHVVTPISVLKNVILGSSLQYRFSKITPSFSTIKEGSTFLTKPLFPQGREDVTALSADFSTSPSLLQGELHILTKPSLLRKEGCNRPPVLGTATL